MAKRIINSSLFQIENVQMDGNWKKLFELVGITEEQQQTKEIMELLYDLVETGGGIENVVREIEMERKAAPPPPSRDMGKLHASLCSEMLK